MPHSADTRSSSAAGTRLTGAFPLRLRIDCEAITGPDTQRGATRMVVTLQETQVLFQVGAEVFDGDVPSTQGILNFIASKYFQALDPSNPEGSNDYLQYLKEERKVRFVDSQPGCWSQGLTITVECSSLQILDELWEDYRTGHLNEMAQRCLVTEDILTAFGITEMRLTTVILEDEYRAGRKYFLTRPATDLLAMGEDDDNGDLPENQDPSVIERQITENFEQLQRRRDELHNAFLPWIAIRARTMEQLEGLATKLHEHHRNVNITTITGASMGTVGGILAIAGLITAPFTFGAGLIVSLVGAGIGGGGGLVMSGSKVVEIILEKLGLKEVQAAIDEDRKACNELQQQLDSLKKFISTLAEFLEPLHDDAVLLRKLEGSNFEFICERIGFEDIGSSTKERVEFGARFFRAASSAATISTSAVATAGAVARSAALAGTRVAHVAGSVISAALLPLDITLLVRSSLELHRGSTTAAVENIRRILDELECPDEEEIPGLVESFINEKFTEACNTIHSDKQRKHELNGADNDDEDEQNDDNEKQNGTDRERLCPNENEKSKRQKENTVLKMKKMMTKMKMFKTKDNK